MFTALSLLHHIEHITFANKLSHKPCQDKLIAPDHPINTSAGMRFEIQFHKPVKLTTYGEDRLGILLKNIDKLRKETSIQRKRYILKRSGRVNCKIFQLEGFMKRSELLQIWRDDSHIYTECDVSLTTHLTLDKMSMLSGLLDYWPGPISVALYFDPFLFDQTIRIFKQYPNILERRDLDMHIVVMKGVSRFENL